MPSPFPGMDPFLEHPALWPDVHNRLIAELGRFLGPRLRPQYLICIEERTYLDSEGLALVARPDISVQRVSDAPGPPAVPVSPSRAGLRSVEVQLPIPDRARESYIEVRTVGGGEVVTMIEILSPSNKTPGKGRRVFEAKRRLVLDSLTHAVEIDLLRGGVPMPMGRVDARADYRILISRSELRPRAELLLFSVRDPIPVFELPLRAGEKGPDVRLREVLDSVYDTASYDLRVDYRAEPEPPLSPADRVWADGVLGGVARRGPGPTES